MALSSDSKRYLSRCYPSSASFTIHSTFMRHQLTSLTHSTSLNSRRNLASRFNLLASITLHIPGREILPDTSVLILHAHRIYSVSRCIRFHDCTIRYCNPSFPPGRFHRQVGPFRKPILVIVGGINADVEFYYLTGLDVLGSYRRLGNPHRKLGLWHGLQRAVRKGFSISCIQCIRQ